MKVIELENLISNIIEDIDNEEFKKEIGTVLSVENGIATIVGLSNGFFDEVIEFQKGAKGIIKSLTKYEVLAVILGKPSDVDAGEEVYRTKKEFSINVSQDVIGRVLNGYGQPIDGGEKINGELFPIENAAPSLKEISRVNEQIITGIKAIDWMICLGYGQRQLIIGDRSTGKSTVASDIMISVKDLPDVISIYVLVGQKNSSAVRLLNKLNSYNVKNFVLIVANSSDEAAMVYMAPFVGCSIGEYFRSIGKKAIWFIDTINAHTVAYREISLAMKKTPGREAFPGDIFYLHSRLLERAANQKEQGKGSLTAIPIVESIDNEVGYIPTNLISITDGQIFLDTNLFEKNIKPSINIGRSVNRIGNEMQNFYLRKICGRLKLELARYEEAEKMVKLSEEVDKETAKLIDFGHRLKEVLLQKEGDVIELYGHILLSYGVMKNIIPRTVSIGDFMRETKRFSFIQKDICEGNEEVIKKTIGEILVCLK